MLSDIIYGLNRELYLYGPRLGYICPGCFGLPAQASNSLSNIYREIFDDCKAREGPCADLLVDKCSDGETSDSARFENGLNLYRIPRCPLSDTRSTTAQYSIEKAVKHMRVSKVA